MIEKEIKLSQGSLFPVSQEKNDSVNYHFGLGGVLTETSDVFFTIVRPDKVEDVKKVVTAETRVSGQLKELMETLVSGGFDKKRIKPRFHPYSGQQVEASDLPTMYYADEEVIEFRFPPVGYDHYPKKFGTSTAYNTQDGYVIQDKPSSVVNYCVPFNECAEESIVFHARTKSHQLWFRWSVEYIEWLEFPEDVGYYLKEDKDWINYSTIGTNKKDTIPMNFVYLPEDEEQDMLFNVDGVNYIVQSYTKVILVARAGQWYDRSGVSYGVVEGEETGTWLCHYSRFSYGDDDCRIITPMVRKYGLSHSTQQVQVIMKNTWTTWDLKIAYPGIPSEPKEVRFSDAIIRERWINTLSRSSFQLLDLKRPHDNSYKAMIYREVDRLKRYDTGELTSTFAKTGIVSKNVIHPTYSRMHGFIIIMKLGDDFLINTRIGDKRVYVDKNDFWIDKGWWYKINPL